jgi:hypothetical protein
MTEERATYTADSERRVVCVVLDAPTLAQLLRDDGLVKLDAGIPQDARCVGVSHDVMGNSINVFFEHPTFDAVDPAQWPPAVAASITLVGDYAQALLRQVWIEFNAEAEAILLLTGTTAGSHYHALANVLTRRGLDIT